MKLLFVLTFITIMTKKWLLSHLEILLMNTQMNFNHNNNIVLLMNKKVESNASGASYFWQQLDGLKTGLNDIIKDLLCFGGNQKTSNIVLGTTLTTTSLPTLPKTKSSNLIDNLNLIRNDIVHVIADVVAQVRFAEVPADVLSRNAVLVEVPYR